MKEQFRGHNISYRQDYPIIYMPLHHKASKNGMVEIHYIIAEEKLGRQLKPGEEVHHKDENRHNYDPTNLIVFDSKQSHTAYHMCMKHDLDMVLTRIDGVWHCEAKQQKTYRPLYVCPECHGPMKSRYAHRCSLCDAKHRAANIPSKKQLMRDMQSLKTFCAIGRKYGVSDNAVRKWYRKYDMLP